MKKHAATITLFFRKLFSCYPIIGDKVKGYTDFNVQYEGVVTGWVYLGEKLTYFRVAGTITISPNWGDDIVRQEDNILVPLCRIRHA